LEPTAMSLSHTILLLAMHSNIQDKLFDELKSSSIDEINILNPNSMNDLKYLDLVCKESLRLMPPIPIISRQTLEDFEIESGVILPEDTCMLINIYNLQRDKKYWGENADQFIPERFLPENSKIYPNSYIPFSAGRRMCIAHKYSKFAIKIFIARLVRKFKFSTSLKEIKPRSVLMLNLCSQHLVQIELRQ
jgi:cytochrome P450